MKVMSLCETKGGGKEDQSNEVTKTQRKIENMTWLETLGH